MTIRSHWICLTDALRFILTVLLWRLWEKCGSLLSSLETFLYWHIYSILDRIGFDKVTTLIRDPDTLKLHRRSLQNFIGTRAIMTQHENLEEVEVRRFLLLVLEDPDKLLDHTRTWVKNQPLINTWTTNVFVTSEGLLGLWSWSCRMDTQLTTKAVIPSLR